MIAQIETAILERLRAASKLNKLGYDLRGLASIPCDIDDRLGEYMQAFPGAWTTFAELRPLTIFGDGTAHVEARFGVIVAARNVGNETASRFGTGRASPGSYQLAMDVAGLLLGQRLGLPISPLTFAGLSSLYGKSKDDKGFSAMALALTTKFTFSPSDTPIDADPVGDFADFRVAWDISPLGGVDLPLTDEAEAAADAADRVALEIQEPAE